MPSYFYTFDKYIAITLENAHFEGFLAASCNKLWELAVHILFLLAFNSFFRNMHSAAVYLRYSRREKTLIKYINIIPQSSVYYPLRSIHILLNRFSLEHQQGTTSQ